MIVESVIEKFFSNVQLLDLFLIFNTQKLASWQFLHAPVFLWAPQWIVLPYSADQSTPQGWSMLAPVSPSSSICFLNCWQNMSILYLPNQSIQIYDNRYLYCKAVPTTWMLSIKPRTPLKAMSANIWTIIQEAALSFLLLIFWARSVMAMYRWCARVNVTTHNSPWRLHLFLEWL